MPSTKIKDLYQVLIAEYCSLVALLPLLFAQTIYLMIGIMLPLPPSSFSSDLLKFTDYILKFGFSPLLPSFPFVILTKL
jgi:hypothetical protein